MSKIKKNYTLENEKNIGSQNKERPFQLLNNSEGLSELFDKDMEMIAGGSDNRTDTNVRPFMGVTVMLNYTLHF